MPEIQAQVEQWRIVFRERWAKPVDKEDEALFNEDFDALIRQVVEECCEIVGKGLRPTIRIKRHFAWLLEGE